MTIKQDWKNWNESNVALKTAKKNMKIFTEHFAKNCEVDEYWQNYLNTLSLERSGLKTGDKEQQESNAFKLRSTSCFYKVANEPQFEVRKCGNVRLDGTVSDGCCGHCEYYGDIKLFANVLQRLEQAQINRNKATIKLLSNVLPFLKTYNK